MLYIDWTVFRTRSVQPSRACIQLSSCLLENTSNLQICYNVNSLLRCYVSVSGLECLEGLHREP
jgi:hypothetical protein